MTELILLALLASPIPLERGTWWEYRELYTQRIGRLDSTEEETTRFTVTGSAGRPFIHQKGGADPVSGPVERGDDWIVLAPWTGEDPLPLPLEPGRVAPAGLEGRRGWVVGEHEKVEVPAGTFEALRCFFRTPRVLSVLWIVPGVGVVREQHGSVFGGRPEIERQLLRWSGGAAAAAAAIPGEE